jgi:hypothetical protein
MLSARYVSWNREMARFSSLLEVLFARWKLWTLMNFLFFGCVLVVAFVSSLLFSPVPYLSSSTRFPATFPGDNFVLMFLSIFVSNLVLSAFLVVSLPGFALFPLSTAFLVFRGLIWGTLLYRDPTWLVLVAKPTLVFEGMAYSLAAVSGTIVGASWIKPGWVYREENFARNVAVRKAFKESLSLYVLIAIILLMAAIVEAATLVAII